MNLILEVFLKKNGGNLDLKRKFFLRPSCFVVDFYGLYQV